VKALDRLRESEGWGRFNESKLRHPVRALMGGREFLPFRERNPIKVGLISVAILAVLTLFAFSLNSFTFLRGVYTIEADFADAAGLTTSNEVRVAGLKVGKVTSIELASARGSNATDRVRVAMEISKGTELGSMSEAEIKLKTILGSKFVEIRPKGKAPLIRDDNIIPLERTRIPFELYEVTNRTVETVGALDAKLLNDALNELADLTDDPEGNLGRALDGLAKATEGLSERDADLEELIQAGGRILDTLGSRSEAVGRIFDSGAQLLGALAARRDALSTFVRGSDKLGRELSDLIRSTRSDLDPALRDLHAALEVVKKDIAPLEKAVEALGPSAKSFGSAFTQGHWGDVWLSTILDLPIPPLLPGGVPTSSGSGVQSIFMSSTMGAGS
jgi:phospholipid/cholesterol/gamma-HCH transport system substrate-binding protein